MLLLSALLSVPLSVSVLNQCICIVQYNMYGRSYPNPNQTPISLKTLEPFR